MPERLNLPRLVTVALCAIIGLQLAWIIAGQLGSRDLSVAGGSAGAMSGMSTPAHLLPSL